ncbi:Protein RTA1 like protein [Verticillium longisporum]|nr:Protein RTA1 like protein [Verticillium longisporum]
MILTRAELLPYKEGIYLWKYVPSLALSIIFLSIFGVLSLAHTWRMFQHRLRFCLPFVVGGYLEVTGCVGRVIARNDTSGLMPYIIQSIFLLVPPSLFAASIYMVLGRIIRPLHHSPYMAHQGIRRRRHLRLCHPGRRRRHDDECHAERPGQHHRHRGPVCPDSLLQPLRPGGRHLRRQLRDGAVAARREPLDWAKLMMMLYATSALILVRCTFRIIEYIMGPEGYLLSNEWPLFVFDLTLMALVMAIFFVWYPSKIKPFPVTDPVGFELATETKKKRSLVERRTSGGVV